MSTEFPYDVFLSHNQADKPRVRRLAERRENQCGLRTSAVGPQFNFVPRPSNFALSHAGRHFIPLLRDGKAGNRLFDQLEARHPTVCCAI